jgi:hypothetical protein
MIRHPSNCVQCVVKPIATVTPPQMKTSDDNHSAAPSLRITMFAGNWNLVGVISNGSRLLRNTALEGSRFDDSHYIRYEEDHRDK